MRRTWHDVAEIALDLRARHPDTNPLTLTLSEIRERVLALPGFADDPAAGTEPVLETIQAAWYDEYED
jgi:FeS assembly protein IscX